MYNTARKGYHALEGFRERNLPQNCCMGLLIRGLYNVLSKKGMLSKDVHNIKKIMI